jgi:hypothetical protein
MYILVFFWSVHITLDNIFDNAGSWITVGSAGPVEGCSDVALAV